MTTLDLLKWRDIHDLHRTFSLASKVSTKWMVFGNLLGLLPNELEAWEIRHHDDDTECWHRVMEHWLTEGGTQDYPATWEGLYELVRDGGYAEVTRDLREAVGAVATKC